MTEAHDNVQQRQPNDVVSFLSNIQSEQKRINGTGHSRNLVAGCGEDPSTLAAASLNALEGLKNEDPEAYHRFLEINFRIQVAINPLATYLGASTSERSYLSALVNRLSLSPRRVLRGNYQVRFSASSARQQVGLSSSTCTTVRNGLSAKGLIVADGEQVDLSPLIETLEPILKASASGEQPLAIQHATPANHRPLPESVTPRDNVSSNVFLNKKHSTVEETGDLFEDESIRAMVRHSSRLTTAIEDFLCCDIGNAAGSDIVRSIPHIIQRLLTDPSNDSFNYKKAWTLKGWVLHRMQALAALVTSLEHPHVLKPGQWFWSVVKQKALDVSSNIKSLVDIREKARSLAEKTENAIKANHEAAISRERQSDFARRAMNAFEEIRAAGVVSASERLWMMAPDRIQVKDDGNVVSWAIRKVPCSTENSTLMSIAKAISERLQLSKCVFKQGVFTDIGPLSSFNNRLRMVEV